MEGVEAFGTLKSKDAISTTEISIVHFFLVMSISIFRERNGRTFDGGRIGRMHSKTRVELEKWSKKDKQSLVKGRTSRMSGNSGTI